MQTSALPLGYAAADQSKSEGDSLLPRKSCLRLEILERETGFEPATSTLARSHSTAELLPLEELDSSHTAVSLSILRFRAIEMDWILIATQVWRKGISAQKGINRSIEKKRNLSDHLQKIFQESFLPEIGAWEAIWSELRNSKQGQEAS